MKPLRFTLSTIFFVLFVLTIQGCASAISPRIKGEVSHGLTFQKVVNDPDIFVGRTVLWGGRIVSTKNLQEGTVIEVIHLLLDYFDRPVEDISSSRGRFLIQYSGFFDAVVYKKGKEITVAGVILGKKVKKIGKLRYPYPLLEPLEIKLWKPFPKRRFPKRRFPKYSPFYYDPFFYDPFFPPYPWRYPGPRRYPYRGY